MPKALKNCPKSNKSPNLVTLNSAPTCIFTADWNESECGYFYYLILSSFVNLIYLLFQLSLFQSNPNLFCLVYLKVRCLVDSSIIGNVLLDFLIICLLFPPQIFSFQVIVCYQRNLSAFISLSREHKLLTWPRVYFAWIQLFCLCWIEAINSFACLAKS